MSKKYGTCALCGKISELTYEHIPPRNAFNAKPSKSYSGDKILFDSERLPWEVDGLKYTSNQRGAGRYFLCRECNNNTGSWYANTYNEIASVIAQAIFKSKEEPIQGIKIEGIYGVRFIKQILSMFCSVNHHLFLQKHINQHIEEFEEAKTPLGQLIIGTKRGLKNAAIMIDELRNFVLDREKVGIDKSKFKICMYITDSNISKFVGIVSSIDYKNNDFLVLSEITSWPLGFVLYFNPPANFEFTGVDITALSDLRYDEKVNIEFPFQIQEMNTVLPLDYRSKEQIESDTKRSLSEE